MPIDDHPIDVLKERLQTEAAFVSPVTAVAAKLLNVAALLPLRWPMDKVIDRIRECLGQQSADRVELLLQVCADGVRKHDDEINQLREALSPEAEEKRAEAMEDLLLDGARKAETTRDRERVKRIGLILANATVETHAPDADEIEEMMRVAMDLSDADVEHLRELIRIEGHLLRAQDRIPRPSALGMWEKGSWGSKRSSDLDSIFSKLESYGLVSRLAPPNNLNAFADFQNKYVLLREGLRFSELIQEAAKT
jgi:hypothetical protein